MANLSYCRFRNTTRDLDDCANALEDLLSGDAGYPGSPAKLSSDEGRAAAELIGVALEIVQLVADANALDLNELAEEMEATSGKKFLAAMLAPFTNKD